MQSFESCRPRHAVGLREQKVTPRLRCAELEPMAPFLFGLSLYCRRVRVLRLHPKKAVRGSTELGYRAWIYLNRTGRAPSPRSLTSRGPPTPEVAGILMVIFAVTSIRSVATWIASAELTALTFGISTIGKFLNHLRVVSLTCGSLLMVGSTYWRTYGCSPTATGSAESSGPIRSFNPRRASRPVPSGRTTIVKVRTTERQSLGS